MRKYMKANIKDVKVLNYLIEKYGKSDVLNAINELSTATYFNAAKRDEEKYGKKTNRSHRFFDKGVETLNIDQNELQFSSNFDFTNDDKRQYGKNVYIEINWDLQEPIDYLMKSDNASYNIFKNMIYSSLPSVQIWSGDSNAYMDTAATYLILNAGKTSDENFSSYYESYKEHFSNFQLTKDRMVARKIANIFMEMIGVFKEQSNKFIEKADAVLKAEYTNLKEDQIESIRSEIHQIFSDYDMKYVSRIFRPLADWHTWCIF